MTEPKPVPADLKDSEMTEYSQLKQDCTERLKAASEPVPTESRPTETSSEIDWADRAAERIYMLYRDSNYFRSMPKEPLIQGSAEIIRAEFFKTPPVMFGFKTVEEWEKFARFAASSALLPVGRQLEHRIYTSAVIRRGEKFLCIHHTSLGVWLFPGGKPKEGEPFLDCLIRECREELGITITSASFREAFINSVKGRQWVGLFYDVEEFEGEPHILEPQNHSALEWLSFEEMQQRATNQPEMGIASFCRAEWRDNGQGPSLPAEIESRARS